MFDTSLVKKLYDPNYAATCFFRSALYPPNLKVIIQVTERCNMRCKHCFISATGKGSDLSSEKFEFYIIKKLIKANVKKVTLTGGEPLLNESLIDIIGMLNKEDISTGICTNATLITEELLRKLSAFNVHINVSLDGMFHTSHGKFRGISDQNTSKKILENIQLIGKYNMLKGVLTTPNKLTSSDEYASIYNFAIESGAKYFLMNQLSPLGRGAHALDMIVSNNELNEIKRKLNKHIEERSTPSEMEVVYIRFPNTDSKPIPKCQAGSIPYVFTNGDIAICPYIYFAAENSDNHYSVADFIIGNIFDEMDITKSLEKYRNEHEFCCCNGKGSVGCVAMKVSKDLSLSANDVL
jgi:MoaA/NifB/PqqE/SkfB family radical SAM enzyme